MSMIKTMLMTATVVGVTSFAGSADAAGLLSTNSATAVSVNTPVASVGTNTNVDAGVKTQSFRKHSAARVDADGTVNTRAEDSATTTDANGNVTARHSSRVHTQTPRLEGEVDARTRVYEDNYVEGQQMTHDMRANDGIQAGASVYSGTSRGFNN